MGAPEYTYRPLGERIVCRLDDLGEVSAGGIIIPDQSQECGRPATVMEAGAGPYSRHGVRVEPSVKRGDKVLLHLEKWRNFDAGKGIVVLDDEGSIMCVLNEGEPEERRYTPLGHRVIVKRGDLKAESAGGVVLPDIARDHDRIGTVLAVGPGRIDDNGRRVPPDVKIGDRVVMLRHRGLPIAHEGKDGEVIILAESDLLCRVEEQSP